MNTPTRDAERTSDEKAASGQDGRDKPSAASDSTHDTITPSELPTEVRVKLRRLDKLEGRYHGLLASYGRDNRLDCVPMLIARASL